MHSRDPSGAVTLLRSMGIKDYEIAASLKIIVGQRVLRELCSECKTEREAEAHEVEAAADHGVTLDKVWDAPGCSSCGETGHRGLRAVFELWRIDEGDRAAILAQENEDQIRARLRERGVKSLVTAALGHAVEGRISVAQALSLR